MSPLIRLQNCLISLFCEISDKPSAWTVLKRSNIFLSWFWLTRSNFLFCYGQEFLLNRWHSSGFAGTRERISSGATTIKALWGVENVRTEGWDKLICWEQRTDKTCSGHSSFDNSRVSFLYWVLQYLGHTHVSHMMILVAGAGASRSWQVQTLNQNTPPADYS